MAMDTTSSFSSVSRFKAVNKLSLVILSLSGLIEPCDEVDLDDGRRVIPLRDAFTLGDTAERAVAPRAIEFGVGEEREGVWRCEGDGLDVAVVAMVWRRIWRELENGECKRAYEVANESRTL